MKIDIFDTNGLFRVRWEGLRSTTFRYRHWAALLTDLTHRIRLAALLINHSFTNSQTFSRQWLLLWKLLSRLCCCIFCFVGSNNVVRNRLRKRECRLRGFLLLVSNCSRLDASRLDGHSHLQLIQIILIFLLCLILILQFWFEHRVRDTTSWILKLRGLQVNLREDRWLIDLSAAFQLWVKRPSVWLWLLSRLCWWVLD